MDDTTLTERAQESWPETIYFDLSIEQEPKKTISYSRGEDTKLELYRHKFTAVMSDNIMSYRLTSGDLKHLDYTRKSSKYKH